MSARVRPPIAAAVLALLVVLALAEPVIAALLGVHAVAPDLALRDAPAGIPHLLGCDDLGRDLFARLLLGLRTTLVVGVGATAIAGALGIAVGTVAGLRRGLVDAVLSRIVDALLALPLLPLLLLGSAAAVGHASGSSTPRLIALLGVLGSFGVARLARTETLRVAALDYSAAARALGAGTIHVVTRHILPSARAVLGTALTIELAHNMLAEAALSFLGLGAGPEAPSLGNMLRAAESVLGTDPAVAFWPGSCILLTVFCVHALADRSSR
jgi:ABC-type dipeptide/oligopeptide/nickel transport system permease subunit